MVNLIFQFKQKGNKKQPERTGYGFFQIALPVNLPAAITSIGIV
jgi:hypothetical protein